MADTNLYDIADKLMAPGKGFLAADESTGTMNKRLRSIGVEESAENRRRFRQLLFTGSGIEKHLSGVIMYDSSIRNQADDGTPFVDILLAKGIIPIIKVDKSTVDHTGFPGEVVTEGLDGLGERLAEYYDMGARAAKWRAVIQIDEQNGLPTDENIEFDAMQLARYAALCHEAGIVPMVEPEVLLQGSHSIEKAEEVTTHTLKILFDTLTRYRVDLKAVILKSSMVLAGSEHSEVSTPEQVAEATIRTFENSVPKETAGIVFLSGGQSPKRATENLQAISLREPLAWPTSYSYSRAIEEPILDVWQGNDENIEKAQEVMLQRLKLNSLAEQGKYDPKMEQK